MFLHFSVTFINKFTASTALGKKKIKQFTRKMLTTEMDTCKCNTET